METGQKHIILVAGEASGDMHAAHLVEAIKCIDSSITFSGLGGSKMRDAGVELDQDLTKMAVVGFFEVIKHFRSIKKTFHLILNKVRERKPAAVILVDYPGFNLRLARELKKLNTKVIYYISPQVWAWKKNRVHFIKKHVDKMLVLFEFEKEFYAQFGVDVECVGHPLVDTIKVYTSREEFLESHELSLDKRTIGILPGSREKEIERHLPIMLRSAEIFREKFPLSQFLIIKASTIERTLLEKYLQETQLPYKIVEDNINDGINACDECLVASGTATLQTAILQKPMVVIYKTSFLSWLLAKLFVKIPNIGLVNVVAGKRIVPECVQFGATPQKIAKTLMHLITDEMQILHIKSDLQRVKESLGAPGASERAAKTTLRMIAR